MTSKQVRRAPWLVWGGGGLGMLQGWVFCFLAGALWGGQSDAIAGHQELVPLSLGLLALGGVLELRRYPHSAIMAASLAGGLWGALHHAPCRSPIGPNSGLRVKVIALGLGGPVRPLLVAGAGRIYLAKGEASRGSRGLLRSQVSGGLMQAYRYRFVRTGRQAASPPAGDLLLRLSTCLRQGLTTAIGALPLKEQAWLEVMVVGEFRHLPPEVSLAFRHLGLFHLLAISGMHMSFLALALRRLALAPFLALYACRILSPGQWLRLRNGIDIALVALLFIYTSLLGQPQAAQRAYLVSALAQLSLIFWGQIPLSQRLQAALFMQALLFPLAFWSEATVMSWSAYVMVLSLQGLHPWRDALTLLRGQLGMLAVVAALWGEASPVGIISNFILTPLFTSVFMLSLLSLGEPYLGSFLCRPAAAIAQAFVSLLVYLDEKLVILGPLRYSSDLSYGWRLCLLGIAAIIFLKTCRQLSIREKERSL